MVNTRKIKETNRLLLFRNPEEEEILVIKINKDDILHQDCKCNLCNGHSYIYYLSPRPSEMTTYCNLCFQWNKKHIDWKTIYYTPVFDRIIKFVIDNRNMFNEEDLDLIDEFFDLKTNKKIRIRRFLKEEDINVYNNKC